MATVRRALLFTSAERYTSLLINFALIAAVSRLLSPAEIGVSVIGTSIISLFEAVRDVPTAYIVQERRLGRDAVATSFTCMLLLTLALAAGLFACAPLIARWYGDAQLVPYCRLLAIGLLPGPLERPVMALLRRDLAFDRLSVINVAGTAVNATVAIGSAVAGASFMSFAWAGLAGNLTVMALALYRQPDFGIFRPTLAQWRRAMALFGYNAAYVVIYRIPELATYLLLGRFLGIDAVGLYNRARVVNDLPGKVLLSGLAPVAFPAFAAEIRAGRGLGQPYLLALAIVSALHWPAFLMLALLAHPIVAILLGQQWLGIVPLVQVLAIANLFSVSRTLTQPSLMAAGGFRDLLLSAAVASPIGVLLIALGAMRGLDALAWSLVLKAISDSCIELAFVRRHARFGPRDFAGALRRGAIVALATAIPPAAVVTALGDGTSRLGIVVAVPLAAVGWLISLHLTGHPVAGEIRRAAVICRRRLAGFPLADPLLAGPAPDDPRARAR